MVDDAALLRALRRSVDVGARVSVHAENGAVIAALVAEALAAGRTGPVHHARTRPALTEAEATARAITLAELAGAPLYIVHLSAAEALDHVRAARRRGRPVVAETCPQYLLLSAERYREPGFAGAAYVMSPPLRARDRQDDLWRALAGGDIDLVATDHCPFSWHDKRRGAHDFSRIPNGAAGVETRVSLLYDAGVRTGRLSLARWVEVIATAPARLMGLYPRKGTLAPGSDADIVVFDPDAPWTIAAATHHTRCDISIYEGRRGVGAPTTVLRRGETIVDDGVFVGGDGGGRFLSRAPLTP